MQQQKWRVGGRRVPAEGLSPDAAAQEVSLRPRQHAAPAPALPAATRQALFTRTHWPRVCKQTYLFMSTHLQN